jgi:hypothetical protein
MRYLDRLRAADVAQKVFPGDTVPAKLTKPPETSETVPTKLTEPGFVSSAAAGTHGKTFSGQAVTCAACRYFRARPASQPDGACDRYGVEAWANVTFICGGHEASSIVDRAREDRLERIGRQLAARPTGHLVFEANEGDIVTITLAIRRDSKILCAEYAVQPERWDGDSFFDIIGRLS